MSPVQMSTVSIRPKGSERSKEVETPIAEESQVRSKRVQNERLTQLRNMKAKEQSKIQNFLYKVTQASAFPSAFENDPLRQTSHDSLHNPKFRSYLTRKEKQMLPTLNRSQKQLLSKETRLKDNFQILP